MPSTHPLIAASVHTDESGTRLELSGYPVHFEVSADHHVRVVFDAVPEEMLRGFGADVLAAADELELRRRGQWSG